MIVFLDCEVYRNYFLAKFMLENGKKRDFEMYDGHPLDTKGINDLISRPGITLVTFNGISYDLPILSYALSGANCGQIKWMSNLSIKDKKKPWQLETQLRFKTVSVDHIDLIEPAPGVNTSLKIYAGRLHSPKMQDLPIEPDAFISAEDRALLREYCGNDLENTQRLYNAIKGRIGLRSDMGAMYGVDLRSKSDAQIAEAVLSKTVERTTGQMVKKQRLGFTSFRYTPPDYVKFHGELLNSVLNMLREVVFEIDENGYAKIPKEVENTNIRIGTTDYQIGNGGLHSKESCVSYYTTDTHRLVDVDVESYYPNLMINMGLSPAAFGDVFIPAFSGILKERLEAKHSGKVVKNEGLKITLNGTFGKTSSIYSVLYNPKLTIYTTVTGQLSLLMLAEAFERYGIKVISANTDGIVTYCPVGKYEGMQQIIKVWEKRCNLKMEETHYKSIHSRDVNNYISIKTDGKIKTKGIFAPTSLMKTPQNEICTDAVVTYLTEGTPYEETVRSCKDITKFVTVRVVNGGAVKGDETIGKAIRWYYAKGVTGTINYKTNGNKVPRTRGAKPCMNLPEVFPDDVDYEWYEKECKELLMDIGVLDRPVLPKLPRKNSKAWKELLANGQIEENDEGVYQWVNLGG